MALRLLAPVPTGGRNHEGGEGPHRCGAHGGGRQGREGRNGGGGARSGPERISWERFDSLLGKHCRTQSLVSDILVAHSGQVRSADLIDYCAEEGVRILSEGESRPPHPAAPALRQPRATHLASVSRSQRMQRSLFDQSRCSLHHGAPVASGCSAAVSQPGQPSLSPRARRAALPRPGPSPRPAAAAAAAARDATPRALFVPDGGARPPLISPTPSAPTHPVPPQASSSPPTHFREPSATSSASPPGFPSGSSSPFLRSTTR